MKRRDTFRFGLICGTLARAGLERVVCDLALGMHKKGIPVTVFAFQDGPLSIELRQEGVDVVILAPSFTRRTRRLNSACITLRLATGLWRRGIKCANFQGLGVERIGLLASRLGGVAKRTFVFQNNYPQLAVSARNQQYRERVIRILAGFDHFIAVSDQVRDWVVSNGVVKKDKVSTIHNGTDLAQARCHRPVAEVRAELGISADAVVLIQVGRFKEQKNQDVSVEAFAKIACDRPGVHLVFAGDGPLRSSVEKRAEESGVGARIHFLGVRHDVSDLLAASDVFLLPSSWEGLPLSLLEAFAIGLPLVGTDVPGIADAVARCPEAVKLVAPRDSDALAQAIRAAVSNTSWRSRAGEHAKSFVSREFSASTMVERYLALHCRLLGMELD